MLPLIKTRPGLTASAAAPRRFLVMNEPAALKSGQETEKQTGKCFLKNGRELPAGD